MELFQQRLNEFAEHYQSTPDKVFSATNYLADEKWYKELLVDVLGAILTQERIKSGEYRSLLIQLIKKQLDWTSLISTERVLYFNKCHYPDGSTLNPADSLFNMLSGTFQLWTNLRLMLESDQSYHADESFLNLLYGKDGLDVRINSFQKTINELYQKIYSSKQTRMSNAPASPKMPLNVIALLLACVFPNQYYFYKARAYITASEMLEISFEKISDPGLTYLNAIEFADTVKKNLQATCGEINNIDTQAFIYVIAGIGSEEDLTGRNVTIIDSPSGMAKAVSIEDGESEDDFPSESDLEFYIAKHWFEIDALKNYKIVPGRAPYGGQYATDRGTIDLLSYNSDTNEWLVIELKHGDSRTGDDAIGQVLRYMGYVKEKLAKPEDKVSGLLITGSFDPKIKSAISVSPNVSWLIYSVKVEYKDFTLDQV